MSVKCQERNSCTAAISYRHSITSSARPSSSVGTVVPIALAVFGLISNNAVESLGMGSRVPLPRFRVRSTIVQTNKGQLD